MKWKFAILTPMRNVLIFIFGLFLLLPGLVSAEGVPPQDVQEKDPFSFSWQRTREAIEARNLLVVQEEISALENLKLLLGVRSLEQYSLLLLDDASHELSGDHIDEASFYVRKAFQLSPESPKVILAAFSIAPLTGVASRAQLFQRLVSQVISSPTALLSTVDLLFYPLLWAFTFGVLLSILLLFVSESDEMLRVLALWLPLKLRGVLVLPLILLAIVSPFFLGPLAVLFVGALFVYVFLPRFRWIALFGGFVLAVWGFVLPLRENITVWFADEGVQSMLRVYEGGHEEGDLDRLADLVSRRPSDGVALYTYATLLRRFGKYHEAEKAFLQVETLLPSMERAHAQLGILAFLRNDAKQALEYFEKAESEGLSSAAFFFNFSKVAFDLLDTERSRDLAQKARDRDRAFVRELQEREASVGMKDSRAIAEIPLPFGLVFESALTPIPGVSTISENKAGVLFRGLSPQVLGVLGVVLFFLFFLVSPHRQERRFRVYFGDYSLPEWIGIVLKIIPGGAWIWARKPVWGAFILALFFVAILPLVHWPSEAARIFEVFSFSHRVYLIPFGIFLLVLYYISFFLSREEGDE